MPDAFARNTSAEFIAAQRSRSRSRSLIGENGAPDAETYDANAPPNLFIVPSPVYAVSRRDDDHYSPKSPKSPRTANRSLSVSGRPKDIPATVAEGDEQPARGRPVRSGSGNESDQTLADRDIESARDVDGLPIVGEPKYEERALAQRKKEQLAAAGKSKSGEGKSEKSSEKPKEEKKPSDEFLITLKGREHLNPHTWGVTYRWAITGFVSLLVLNATFASSGPSQLIPSIITHFGVSSEVGTLTIALFVAGYCVGPLLWGPLSERYGRKLVFIIAFLPYTGFQVGCALAPNIGALLAFRFLGGCFAAAPLTNSGGVLADIWDADRRGIALAIFSLAPFMGPALAPLVSGAMEVTGTNWRWIFWVLTIFAGICLVAIVFILPETYVPYLLHKEAKRIRKETGDDRWHSASEHPDHKVTIKETLEHTVLKPFIMIVQEPMLLLLTLYLSFVYGIVYLLFEALPIVFQGTHGWNALEGGLVFLALPIGGLAAVIIYALYFNKVYMRKHHELKGTGKMVPPEERLKPLMVAAPTFAIAFFWFGWTYYKSINPVSPILAVVLLGFDILWMFLSIFNYLIDTYLANAASALAINTVCRSAFGAGFPLFASQMYAKLGTPGASSLLGGLALVFMPAPFVLYRYGKKIRSLSKNAMVMD